MVAMSDKDWDPALDPAYNPNLNTNDSVAPDVQNDINTAISQKGTLSAADLASALSKTLPAGSKLNITTDTPSSKTKTVNKVFTKFDVDNDVVVSQRVYTEGVFPGYTGVLTSASIYTSSLQQASTSETKNYFLTVTDGSGTGSNELFDIVYADSGSSTIEQKAMYFQMSNILLSNPTDKFQFGSSNVDSIFVIGFKREQFKETLDPGNWQLTLTSGSTTIHLIDDSAATGSLTKTSSGDKYSVYSGSIADGVVGSTELGNVYTDLGLIVLNGDYITGSFSNITDESTKNTYHSAFFNNISEIRGRSEELLKEANFFCRLYNRDYNYSNNPTFLTGSYGDLRISDFTNTPRVYVTTIGLYNDNNELIATARLNSPIEKTFSKEAIVTVKLSY
jgi:hypothetical protein